MLPVLTSTQLDILYAEWMKFSAEGALLACSEKLRSVWAETGALDDAEQPRDFFELSKEDSEVFFAAWVEALKGSASSAVLKLRGFGQAEREFIFLPEVVARGSVKHVLLGALRLEATRPMQDGGLERASAEFTLSKLSEVKELFSDITKANKQLERALLSARRQIELAKTESEAKTAFLANMSHEIRTPMNAVIGFCDLLSNTRLSDEQDEYVEAISQSGQLLIKLIGQVLDYSKIESGNLELESEAFALEQLLLEVQAMMGARLARKPIEFEVETEAVGKEILIGDATRLKQIFINLLGNAFKFTRKGKISLSVKLTESRHKGHLRVFAKVEDSGIGIEAEHLNSLFCPFSQANTRISKEYGGSGLGLAICKRLCEAMHGDVWVESTTLGRGTIFAFDVHLPVEGAPVLSIESDDPADEYDGGGDGEAFERLEVQSKGLRERAPLRLLVVDDNPNNLLITAKLSQHLGYEAETVTSGDEALKRLGEADFSIVLMDVRMAPLNGIETTRRIREGKAGKSSSQAYIIAVTAHALQGDKEKCLESGMNDYLSKPLTLERLEQSLNRARSELSRD